MTEEDIRRLVEKSRKDGFMALFREYQKYVYAIVWRRIKGVGTAEDAEECVSDIFTHIFIHFNDIDSGALHGYISTVASRMAINHYYSLCSGVAAESDDESIHAAADDTDIAAELEISERNRELYGRIRALGEPDSTLIIQKYYYERKSKDIAKMVGMTPTAVRVRLNRALKRLREMLKNENFVQ